MTEQAVIEAVPELGEGFKGEVISPGDLDYDDARAVWNGSIDKRPALIVRPRGAADVIDAVNYARARDLPLAVRCGGHSVAGNGTVDGGVLVDLANLKGVHVDPEARPPGSTAACSWASWTGRPSCSVSPPRPAG
jgi:FAD/FMN-containing dehydrogenase